MLGKLFVNVLVGYVLVVNWFIEILYELFILILIKLKKKFIKWNICFNLDFVVSKKNRLSFYCY